MSSTPTSGIISSLFGLITGNTDATTNTSGAVDQFSTDTLSTSNATQSLVVPHASTPVLPAPSTDVNLLQWHKIISSATVALTNQLQLADTQSMLLSSSMWQNLGEWATAIRALQASMEVVANNEIAQSADYNTNTADPFNSFIDGINVTTGNMNTVQQEYIAGTITTAQYNAAVTQWNSNVGGLNTQIQTQYDNYIAGTNAYNDQVTTINQAITTINDQLTAGGVTNLIPLETPVVSPFNSAPLLPTNLPPGPPPPSTLVPASIATVPDTTAPADASSFLETYFVPIFQATLSTLSQYSSQISLVEAYRQFNYYTLQGGKTNLLPNDAYVEPFPKAFFSTNQGSNSSTIAGVGLTTTVLGLSNPNLTSVITNSLAAQSAKVYPLDSGRVVPTKTTINSLLLSVAGLEKASIASALPALTLLGGALNPNQLTDNPAATAALGLTNLNAIKEFLDSGVLEKELSASLISSGLTQDEVNSALPSINAAVTIGLLQAGVTQVAISQGLPGLLPQILGNLPNVNLQQQLISASANNFSDFFQNEINVLNLKSTLAAQLIKDNLSQENAENTANNAVNATLANQTALNNADDLREALQTNLINQGLNSTTATNLTQQALNFVNTGQQLPGLDTTINQQAIQQAALNSDNTIKQNLQDGINKALAQENSTNREFLKNLTTQLEQQGNDSTTANFLATQVLVASQTNPFSTDRINKDILTNSINSANHLASPGVSTTNLTAAINGTLALAPQTEIQFRQTLAQQLQSNGINKSTAQTIAQNAAITQTGNDPLKSLTIGGFLTRDQLAAQLTQELNSQFSGNINPNAGAHLGNQLALALVGSTTPTAAAADDIQRPTSVLNRLNQAYVQLKTTLANNFDNQVATNFTDFIAPKTTSFFDFYKRISDPGTSLFQLSSGIMYQGMGRKPTNYKESIDIPV